MQDIEIRPEGNGNHGQILFLHYGGVRTQNDYPNLLPEEALICLSVKLHYFCLHDKRFDWDLYAPGYSSSNLDRGSKQQLLDYLVEQNTCQGSRTALHTFDQNARWSQSPGDLKNKTNIPPFFQLSHDVRHYVRDESRIEPDSYQSYPMTEPLLIFTQL